MGDAAALAPSVQQIRKLQPHLVLIENSTTGAQTEKAVERLRQAAAKARIVLLGNSAATLQNGGGVDGVLLKTSSVPSMLRNLRRMASAPASSRKKTAVGGGVSLSSKSEAVAPRDTLTPGNSTSWPASCAVGRIVISHGTSPCKSRRSRITCTLSSTNWESPTGWNWRSTPSTISWCRGPGAAIFLPTPYLPEPTVSNLLNFSRKNKRAASSLQEKSFRLSGPGRCRVRRLHAGGNRARSFGPAWEKSKRW